MGKTIVAIGAGLVLLGLIAMALERIGLGLGRLPGDVNMQGRGWRLSAPIATGLLLSLIVTVLLNLGLWLSRRR
jgi:hypothetical protein